MVHNATRLKMAHQYEKKQYTSKDVGTGPQYGSGFDPVLSHATMKNRTGPLRRKQGTSSEDYMDVMESERWMDAKQAAKVLHIKEEELATLTREKLEERWVKVYKEKTNAQQSEILIAAEVLLEYLDSTVFLKKNRQYYRNFIENARVSVDVELQAQRQEQRQQFIWAFGFAVFGASVSILIVAYLRNVITRKDAESIGAKTKDFVLMTFLQSKNVEPAPDYSRRYASTPTAAELDAAAGRYDMQYLDSQHARLLEEKRAQDKHEQAELLKMLNDENERRAKAQLAARREEVGDSRVKVYRPEDIDPATGQPLAEAPAARPAEAPARFNHYTFRQFADMMATSFGGGSRIQRITSETSARADELRRMKERAGTATTAGGDSA
ncbi:hypothetical protein STCU_00395 [Strigomonas culicis]|nr:hypothetical protein STCU_00395 [Strigomonas culicis]|eukprot:EPY36811.1 hypothetical protein STCU_00395 [Strigomonas culicis]